MANLSLGIVIGATVSGSVARAFETLDQRATRLGRTLQQVRAGRVAGTAAGEDISNLIRQEERLAGSLQRTNTLRANRSRRSELGGEVMSTVGLAMMAAAPMKAAADFETVMTDVRESVKLTDGEFNTLGKSILQMSTTLPITAKGFGEIVTQGGKLGIANKDLAGFAQNVGELSIALGISGEEAGVMMAHWRTSMGLSQQQAVLLGDAVNTLGDTMNISATDLAEVIRKEGAYAISAGFSVAQTAALGAALLNSGTPAKQAGMVFKGLTSALLAGEGATKKQTQAFEDLGLKSTDVTARMKTDAVGALNEVLAAIAKQPKELQGGIIGNLFGPKAKEPILALLANTQSLTGALNTVADASKYAGANQEEAGKKSATAANQLIMSANSASELGVVIGQALLPTLKALTSGFSTVAGWLSSLSTNFQPVISVVAGLGAAMIALKVVMLAGGFAATFISDAWTLASGAMAFFTSGTAASTAALVGQKIAVASLWVAQQAMAAWTATCTAAQWLWNVALSANPIGLVVIGVTAFGVLAYTVYKNWEPIAAWFKGVWATMSAGVGGMVASVTGAFSSMAATVRGIWESLINWLSAKFAQIGAAANGLISTAQTIGNTMQSIGKWATSPAFGKAAVVGATMAVSSALPAHATPLPPMSTGKQPQSIMYNNNNTIHVTQKPGEDSNDLADRIIKKMENKQAADKRGRLHD
jgi:TP901 family phage tail tape measure protein